MKRTILVFRTNQPNFSIDIPEGARLSFGPWTPPKAADKYGRSETRELSGTLRIYEGRAATSSVLAVFSGVEGYRDTSLNYSELV